MNPIIEIRKESEFPEYISASQLDKFSRCPFWFMKRYTHQVEEPPNRLMARGKLFHWVMEQKFKRGLSIADVWGSREFANAGYKFYSDLDKPATIDEINEDLDVILEWFDISMRIMEDQQIVPVKSELEIIRRIDGVPIKGIIDIVDQSGMIVDFKTGTRLKSQRDADHSIQLTLYAMLINLEENIPICTPRPVAFISLAGTKGKVTGKFIKSEMTESSCIRIRGLIASLKKFKEIGFFPIIERSKCPRWCPLYATCHEEIKKSYQFSDSAIVPYGYFS